MTVPNSHPLKHVRRELAAGKPPDMYLDFVLPFRPLVSDRKTSFRRIFQEEVYVLTGDEAECGVRQHSQCDYHHVAGGPLQGSDLAAKPLRCRAGAIAQR
jgi:hypothetical protein